MLLQVPCPYCQCPATRMTLLSEICVVDYYRCDACARVSEKPKGASGLPVPLTTPHRDAPADDLPLRRYAM